MKNTLKVLILGLIFSAFSLPLSQENTYNLPIDANTQKVTYKEVVSETGTKDELYDRAYEWAKHYFVNISSSVKVRDKEKGIIKGETRFKVSTLDKKGVRRNAGAIRYEFSIELKDNKYRIIETNFKSANNSGNAVELWFKDTQEEAIHLHQQVFKQMDQYARLMIKSLKAGMKPKVKAEDSW